MARLRSSIATLGWAAVPFVLVVADLARRWTD
jgi:hypothetical protein